VALTGDANPHSTASRFFSLDDRNSVIRERVDDRDGKITRKLVKSRREKLETSERPAQARQAMAPSPRSSSTGSTEPTREGRSRRARRSGTPTSVANPADVYFGRGQTILLQEKGSNVRPSAYAACGTAGKPRNLINQASQSLP
jgi:hypothetical protein